MTTILLAALLAWYPPQNPNAALADVLLFYVPPPIDQSAYPAEVKQALHGYTTRLAAYRSKRARPRRGGEDEMVYQARVHYERRLAAASDHPRAPALAFAYVNALRPCYEWEGFHDCPEREAVFAEAYQATHPRGPFRKFLPLLAAHRWLCAAEGYQYEEKPGDAERTRRAYERAIATARSSADPLVRTAAEGLAARGRCYPPQ